MEIYISLLIIIALIIFQCLRILKDDYKELDSILTDKPDFSRYVNKNSIKY